MAIGARALEGLVTMHPGQPDPAFWRGRRVLLTGHTGFKGAWLAFWLQRLGAQVSGLALQPPTNPSLFEALDLARSIDHAIVDLRDARAVADRVQAVRPEIVLHLGAQALVRESYRDPVANWASNLMGTVHLLDALRGQAQVQVAVLITTDKVYRNRETSHAYREDDELGGHDPYSASKAACELAIASYRDAFLREQGLPVASVRAGNVIGGGDWAAERLLPDAVRAWRAGQTLQIRRPDAVRPWQHVLEPLAAYLVLAQRLCTNPTLARPWNIGPPAAGCATVRDVVELARSHWHGAPSSAPAVHYGPVQTTPAGPHEAGLLTLDATAARETLGVAPHWPLAEAVARTVHWYRAHGQGADVRGLCEDDLEAWTVAGAAA